MSRRASLRLERGGRAVRASLAAVSVLTLGALFAPVASATPAQVPLPGSAGNPGGAPSIGAHNASSQLLVTLVLAPRGGDAMDRLIASLSNPNSPNYHRWLANGEFYSRFAPSSSVRSSVHAFL